MTWLKRAWRFVRTNWKWFVSGAAIVIGAILAAQYSGKLGKSQILQHKLTVKRAEREIGRLEGRREMIREREGSVETDIEGIDVAIEKLKDTVKRSRSEVDRLTSKEKLDEFKRLGY